MAKKTLLFGVGVNDSLTPIRCRKTKYICPYYVRWAHMIKRCYSELFHSTNPTYKDCSVCDEWLCFSSFKSWMKKEDWKDKQLDKDIIKPRNKIYSPETCAFVTSEENHILCDAKNIRGKYPKGVCYHNINKNFLSYITIKNKRVNLGSHDSIESAVASYKKAKKNALITASKEATDPRIAKGFLLHASFY
tara:strand:- start:16 stop:588 length:573 start_codon:yes stop_codon:yes gene_type:complete